MRIRNKRRRNYGKYLKRKLFLAWFHEKYEVTLSKPHVGEDGAFIVTVELKERKS